MGLTATIEEKYTLNACDKKVLFQQRLLERIREHIGTCNKDQYLKEKILAKIASKITSVYIGCFEKIEQVLGEEIWAYKVAPEIFDEFSPEEQEQYKRMAKLWNECRLAIKDWGNKVIDSVIDDLDSVIFTKRKERMDCKQPVPYRDGTF